MGFSRAGIAAHLDPWRSIWSSSGNAFEVNFVPDYKILHDAGYNVLAYDLRNFGHSGAANGARRPNCQSRRCRWDRVPDFRRRPRPYPLP
jgi:pimeloyl-ACP methyl ester carboxylesterase